MYDHNPNTMYQMVNSRHQDIRNREASRRAAEAHGDRSQETNYLEKVMSFAKRVSDKFTTQHEPVQEVTLNVNRGHIG